jgi:hypothetical protein
VQIRFDYQDSPGRAEPYRLISWQRRWCLVVREPRTEVWSALRLDRLRLKAPVVHGSNRVSPTAITPPWGGLPTDPQDLARRTDICADGVGSAEASSPLQLPAQDFSIRISSNGVLNQRTVSGRGVVTSGSMDSMGFWRGTIIGMTW